MFNIGAGEMMFILVAALLILGPQRLPELARGIGKFLREFRRQTDEVRTVVTREFYMMDQEIQREPVRPPPASTAPVPAPAEQAALPPLELPATLEGGAYAPQPQPAVEPQPQPAVEPKPQAVPPEPVGLVAAQGVQAAAQAGAPEATPGESSEEQEALPRLAPIPGTVARNAPKQS